MPLITWLRCPASMDASTCCLPSARKQNEAWIGKGSVTQANTLWFKIYCKSVSISSSFGRPHLKREELNSISPSKTMDYLEQGFSNCPGTLATYCTQCHILININITVFQTNYATIRCCLIIPDLPFADLWKSIFRI